MVSGCEGCLQLKLYGLEPQHSGFVGYLPVFDLLETIFRQILVNTNLHIIINNV